MFHATSTDEHAGFVHNVWMTPLQDLWMIHRMEMTCAVVLMTDAVSIDKNA